MFIRNMKSKLIPWMLILLLICGMVTAEAKTVTCTYCSGTGRTMCSFCHGSGRTTCTSCGGLGTRGTSFSTFDPLTGMMKPSIPQLCTACGGQGTQSCLHCTGGWNTCWWCGGSGTQDDGKTDDPKPVTTETKDGDDPGVPYETAHGTVLAGTKSNFEWEGLKDLFDGNKETKYCTVTTSLYVIWKAPKPITVSGYVITTGNDNSIYKGRNPKSWILYGSTKQLDRDSADWKIIDQVKNDTVLKDKDIKDYQFKVASKANAYQYFKLEISENCGDGCIQMSEFTLQGSESEQKTGEAASIKLNKTKASVKKGKTVQLKVKKPEDANVTWKSSDKKIATVNKNGKVKGKKKGTCIITCTTADGTTAECKITVK